MRGLIGMAAAGGMVGLVASTAAAGQYVVTTITAPGLTTGSANSVNDLGMVVGEAVINGVDTGSSGRTGSCRRFRARLESVLF